MQHIEIHDATHCTIVNLNGNTGQAEPPAGSASRVCPQCDMNTWRLTPICMHCGYDRWARYKLAVGTTAGIAALALGVLIPLK